MALATLLEEDNYDIVKLQQMMLKYTIKLPSTKHDISLCTWDTKLTFFKWVIH